MEEKPTSIKGALVCIGVMGANADAIRFAELVSQALDLEPVLFHVSSPDAPADKAERVLSDAQQMLKQTAATTLIVEGDFKSQLLAELERKNYSLVILGTSEEEPDQPATQLSQRLATRIENSTLIIRNPPSHLEHVLICTGGQPTSTQAVSWGIRMSQSAEAHATILHVASGAPAMYTGLPALEESLSEMLSYDNPLSNHLREAAGMAEAAGVSAKLELRHGIVAEEILRACEIDQSNMIVIGAPKPGAILDRLVLGRVGPQLLSSCTVPILIVRSEDQAPKEM